MRGTALGLGIAGGVIGLIIAALEYLLRANGAGTVSWPTVLAFVAAVAGIIGGALALRKSRIAAGMMLGACIAGFIGASAFWTPAATLLFLGALLSLLAHANRSKPRPPQIGIPSE
jgi:hypothetical protein